MAKKGSTFNKYSYEFKMKVVEAYLSGNYGGYDRVAKEFGLKSPTQIKQWVKKYHEDGGISLSQDKRGVHFKGKKKSIKLEDMPLEDQVKHLKMENEILKKYHALLKTVESEELLNIES